MHLVGLYTYRLACWAYIPLIGNTSWWRRPGRETVKRLILVINCIVLSSFVCWCVNYKNMYGMNNIKFAFVYLTAPLTAYVGSFLSSAIQWQRFCHFGQSSNAVVSKNRGTWMMCFRVNFLELVGSIAGWGVSIACLIFGGIISSLHKRQIYRVKR